MIVDEFHGMLRSTLQCKTCRLTASSFDAFQTLALPIPSGPDGGSEGGGRGGTTATLGDCFDLFSAPEEVGGDDAWKCPKCKEHRTASKQVSIYNAPTSLVVQLKRFRCTREGRRLKIEDAIRIPAVLDVAPYLAGKSSWYRVI